MATYIGDYKNIVPLFNPRLQDWSDHFNVKDGIILPNTEIAEATIKLLKLNNPDRIIQRQILMKAGLYP